MTYMIDALEHARDVCKYLDAGKIEEAKAHTEFYWDALDKIRDKEEAEKNQFNPDWDAVQLLSKENLALHKRIAELKAEKQELQQRQWIGLTDDEIARATVVKYADVGYADFYKEFARSIEAKLKEKNT